METNIYYHQYAGENSWLRITTKFFPLVGKEVPFVEIKAEKTKPFSAALYDAELKKPLLREMYNSIGEFLKLEKLNDMSDKSETGFAKKCKTCNKDFTARHPAQKICDECKKEVQSEVKETDQNG